MPHPQVVSRIALLLFLLISSPAWLDAQLQPNIILINLDDADHEMLSPATMALLLPNLSRFAEQGVQLTNFHVTTPICGPSRASLLRGQYAHHTGILSNGLGASRSNGFDGGVESYFQRGYHENDLSTWMKTAGYHTMQVGKFLHDGSVNEIPPGWDDFYSSRGANYFGTFRFTNQFFPAGQAYLEPISVYRTTQESQEMQSLIDQHVARANGQPFFMYFAPLAPHLPTAHTGFGMVEPQYQGWWPDLLPPHDDSVNELDFSDKSTAIRSIPPLTNAELAWTDSIHRERMLSLKSIDDMFAALTDQLQQLGLTENTYIFLTSDNGFHNGHQRLIGKAVCFDRASRVPTYVLGPGVAAGRKADHLLAHIDLAPTIAELGNAEIPTWVDGKSFLPLLWDPDLVPPAEWRDAIVIETWETITSFGNRNYNTASRALRMFESVYIEWANGSAEFYDLVMDPFQLANVYDWLSAADQAVLADDLRAFWKDELAPETTITVPWDDLALISKKRPLVGMADDDSGISRVRLAFLRFRDGFYWNGQTWQPERVLVDAELTNPGQSLTTWTYQAIPRSENESDAMGLWARAYDDQGHFDRTLPMARFRTDVTRPESEIITPANHQTIDGFRLLGQASDNQEVDRVRLVIRNFADDLFYDGSQWTSSWTYFEVPVLADGTWAYEDPELQGEFWVSCRAVDWSGNVEATPPQIRLVVEE